jgi:hypothetical protein
MTDVVPRPYLFLNSDDFGRGNYIRYYGLPVRPVRDAD